MSEAAFDPDKFLAETAAPEAPFDPDAFLGQAPAHLPPKVGAGETFLNKAVDAIPAGRLLTNALSALAMKALGPKPGVRFGPAALAAGAQQPQAPSLMDEYRGARDDFAARTAQGSADHPWASGLGTAAGTGLSLLAPLPKVGKIGTGAGGRVLSNALTAGGYGTLNGALNSRGDLTRGDVGQVLGDAVGLGGLQQAGHDFGAGNYGHALLDVAGAGGIGGALAGGVIGGALEGGRAGIGAGLQRWRASVSPSAQRLGALGVDTKKLSLGQLNPEGYLAQLEEVGEHGIAGGHAIKAAREGGREAWQAAAQAQDGAPLFLKASGNQPAALAQGPRVGPDLALGPAQRLAAANASFEPAYNAIRNHPIANAGAGEQSIADQLRKSFAGVVAHPDSLATDADRAAVARYLDNQATLTRYAAGQPGTVEPLMTMRSNIRSKLATLPEADAAKSELLRNAEEHVTKQIEANLSPESAALLKATDQNYALHKTLEDAIKRAGDSPAGFQPSHLSAAIRASTDNGAYARGAGGSLRDLAATGQQVFNAKVPLTGAKALIHNIPFGKFIAGPIAAMANQPAWKQALLNGPGLASQAASPVSGKAYELLANALRAPQPMMSPGLAQNDEAAQQLALAEAMRQGAGR